MHKLALNSMKYKKAELPRIGLYRSCDVVISLFALALLIPLFASVAIIVLVALGRPVFFVQERIGLMGEIFLMFKFRTLAKLEGDNLDTESSYKKKSSDSCCEFLLGMLRDLKLDELPQFWNVLRGDMSLVGPRPEQPHIHRELCKSIPGFDQRLSLKPGITGWAQIHEPQAQALGDAARKLAWDRHYIENQSMWLYFKILTLTLGVLFVELPCRKDRQSFGLSRTP